VPRPPVGRFKQPDLGDEEPARRPSKERAAYVAEDQRVETKSGKGRLIVLGVLALAAVGGAFAWYQSTHPAAPPADVPTSLLLASLTNTTGDTTLSGLFHGGLQFELEESPHISVRGSGDLTLGLKVVGLSGGGVPSIDDARRAAHAVGAANVAIGSMEQQGASSYALTVKIYDVASGARVTDSTEVAASREQIGDAVDRLASDLRSALGETGDSIGKSSVPLNNEASGNLDALQAYVSGDALRSAGKIDDAMFAFQRAVGMDAKFTQAYVALAEIYRQQKAEVAAAQMATKAQDNSAAAGAKTQALAEASYDINTLGDYAHAIGVLEPVCANYPADVALHLQLALAQRLAGKFAESLGTAQAVLKIAPYNAEASGDAELAMIAQGHEDAAATMEQQGAKVGQGHPGIGVLIALLTSTNAPAPDATTVSDHLAAQMDAAAVLDAGGQFAAGLSMWRDIANRARAAAELASAGSYALAHAALDRALAGDCSTALGLIRDAGANPARVWRRRFVGVPIRCRRA